MYQIFKDKEKEFSFDLIGIKNNKIFYVSCMEGYYGNVIFSYDIYDSQTDFLDSYAANIFNNQNLEDHIFLEENEALFIIKSLLKNGMDTNYDSNDIYENVSTALCAFASQSNV